MKGKFEYFKPILHMVSRRHLMLFLFACDSCAQLLERQVSCLSVKLQIETHSILCVCTSMSTQFPLSDTICPNLASILRIVEQNVSAVGFVHQTSTSNPITSHSTKIMLFCYHSAATLRSCILVHTLGSAGITP